MNFSYNYVGEGSQIGGHNHRPFEVRKDGKSVAGGVVIVKPDGETNIRVHGYHREDESEIRKLFPVKYISEFTFTKPL